MDKASLYQRALHYLSRREHSQVELQRKLVNKGGDIEQVQQVIAELAANQLQSDDRFVSVFIHSRSQAGYGPRRILLELKARGINNIPECLVDENQMMWIEALERIWQKKFAKHQSGDLKSKAKQARFLLQRGFSPEQVHAVLKRYYEVFYEKNE